MSDSGFIYRILLLARSPCSRVGLKNYIQLELLAGALWLVFYYYDALGQAVHFDLIHQTVNPTRNPLRDMRKDWDQLASDWLYWLGLVRQFSAGFRATGAEYRVELPIILVMILLGHRPIIITKPTAARRMRDELSSDDQYTSCLKNRTQILRDITSPILCFNITNTCMENLQLLLNYTKTLHDIYFVAGY